jgi:UDP-N-acetylmuramyl tripeptide synthase
LRGGGSSLPGLVVERLDADFAVRILGSLPYGCVVISGTNGKTTTTRIVCELLRGDGLRVFSNDSGSNFMRGVISSLLRKVTLAGRLDADIAVLELDEAHAVDFARRARPRHSLLLNVMRDQLDRFGEIDHTADLLAEVARATTGSLVLNREDRRVASIAGRDGVEASVTWYGLHESLAAKFPQDDDLYGASPAPQVAACAASGRPASLNAPLEQVTAAAAEHPGSAASPRPPLSRLPVADPSQPPYRKPRTQPPQAASLLANDSAAASCRPAPSACAAVTLDALDGNKATFAIGGTAFTADLALKGVYNAYNAAAALALVRCILPASEPQALMRTLAGVTSAFGRGEELQVGETSLELLLVKNPGGFRLALESFDASEQTIMIAINDEYADGRDMSWLYDVPFASLREAGVCMVSGTRAFDMALRLHYDEVPFAAVQTDLAAALPAFLAASPQSPHRVYCTYTAMLALRRQLAALTTVSKVM